MVFALEKNKDKKTLFLIMVGYYKKRPDNFIIEVMGIRLNLYQRVLVRGFFQNKISIWAMGRGLGKSWLAAVCLVAYCLLNPNTKSGVLAPSFRQAKSVVKEKIIDDILNRSSFLKGEIKSYNCSVQQAEIVFLNGSFIRAFPMGVGNEGEKIRGARLNIILVDEYAYVGKEVVNMVITPMMVVKRNYKVGDIEEENIEESNKFLMTSTMNYRFNHFFQELKANFEKISKGTTEKVFAISLTYEMGLLVRLFDESVIEKAKLEMSSEIFDMEYNAIAPRLVDGAWISYDDLMGCCNLENYETLGYENFHYIMSVDVARQEGQDNTIIMILKLVWINDHYEPEVVYIKSLNGCKFEDQAKKVREILSKYPTTQTIFMDTQTIGLALKDELAKPYFDEINQCWYNPLIDMNDEVAMSNIAETNGIPIIYGIKPTAEINHKMGYSVKKYTQKRWIHFYGNETGDNKEDLTMEEKLLLRETQYMCSEVMSMKTKINGQWIKFYTDDILKDRWSCLCYGLFGVDIKYEEKIAREKKGSSKVVIKRRFNNDREN